jgi:hypothetical protein
MCPACLAAISMIVAGVVSTGGAAALAIKARNRENGEPSGALTDQAEVMGLKERTNGADELPGVVGMNTKNATAMNWAEWFFPGP